jgi:hypothetical protein
MSTIGKFAALSLLVVVGSLAVGAALNDNVNTYTAENESVTQDVGNWTEVVRHDDVVGYLDNETVYNEVDNELTEGTDYEWDTTNGSIYWYDTGDTTDGAEATVIYSYLQPAADSRALAHSTYYGGLAVVVLVLFGGAVQVIQDWFGRF